jgi:hypothetical protein
MPAKKEYNTKGEKREAKHRKKRYGMKIDGRSVMTIKEILRRKAEIRNEKTRQ